jgi:hypothetical protein
MSVPARWCVKCHKGMRSYNGATGPGMCWACHHNQPRVREFTEVTDDSPAVIEAKFQAARQEIRRQRLCSTDLPWSSSLTRVVS